MKTYFITGGAGFIANTIIRRLVEENRIVVYDNFTRDTLTGSDLNGHANIEVVKGDVLDYVGGEGGHGGRRRGDSRRRCRGNRHCDQEPGAHDGGQHDGNGPRLASGARARRLGSRARFLDLGGLWVHGLSIHGEGRDGGGVGRGSALDLRRLEVGGRAPGQGVP